MSGGADERRPWPGGRGRGAASGAGTSDGHDARARRAGRAAGGGGREDPRGRVRAARGLARRLASASVIVFPEGKTGARRLPGPFHPGLFRLLHRLGVPVVPVTIRYGDRRAYWTDDSRLVSHLWTRVLAGPSLPVAVHVGTALDPRAEADGESLARAAYHAVCRPIEDLDELV